MRLVTFQQRSFLSPWPLATARYKGNFLLLQVTFLFSQAPSVGKGEVREGSIRATVTLLFVWTAWTAVWFVPPSVGGTGYHIPR